MLVINEVLVNPDHVGDGQGEWFELYNPNSYDIDIRGFQIKDDGSDSQIITSDLPVVVPAGGYLVLGQQCDVGDEWWGTSRLSVRHVLPGQLRGRARGRGLWRIARQHHLEQLIRASRCEYGAEHQSSDCGTE